MDALEVVYLCCFFVGLGFAIIMGLLAGVFGGGGDVDVGGDVDFGGDVGGHDGGLHSGDMVHFSPVSPVVLATFVSTFGGAGIIFKKVGWAPYIQIPAAFGAAFLVAGLVFLGFYKLFQLTQHSSEARQADLIGIEAQVTVRIPIDGVGQIGYTVGSSRYTAPTRALDGKEIGTQSIVKIVKIVGNIFYVERVT